MTQSQTTIWNRTEMHSGVRGATELLQQEVGQAGRVAAPATITTGAAIAGAGTGDCNAASPGVCATTVPVTSVAGLFATAGAVPSSYTLITTIDGDSRETTPIWSINAAVSRRRSRRASTTTTCAGTVLMALGGFAQRDRAADRRRQRLDGIGAEDVRRHQRRRQHGVRRVHLRHERGAQALSQRRWPSTPTRKPPLSDAQVLLSNVMPNPGGTPCFTYQTSASPPMIVQGQPFVFVLDVAITLTVQTQQIDPITKQYQTETKALLNVSPRNVYNAWQLASIGYHGSHSIDAGHGDGAVGDVAMTHERNSYAAYATNAESPLSCAVSGVDAVGADGRR